MRDSDYLVIDIEVGPGCITSFTVTATNTDTYQWQQLNGATWNNLSDSGIFSGTTSNTLTLTKPTVSNNGNQYRVIVSNSALICISETSNIATLTIVVNTVITNLRISYRVSEN